MISRYEEVDYLGENCSVVQEISEKLPVLYLNYSIVEIEGDYCIELNIYSVGRKL